MPKNVTPSENMAYISENTTFVEKFLGALKWTLRFIKRRWLVLLIIAIVLVPIIAIAAFIMAPDKPEIITENAEKGTLLQTVEAVGTIISEKDLELKFPVTGVVAQVSVREGDQVTAGTILAALRGRDVSQAEVNSAAAAVQSAQANLQALVEGTRPEEIAIAEAEVANKRASLEVAKTALNSAEANLVKAEEKWDLVIKEADMNLAGDINSAGSSIYQQGAKVQSSLFVIENIFNTTIVRNAVEFHSPTRVESMRIMLDEAKNAVQKAVSNANVKEYNETLDILTDAKTAFQKASDASNEAYMTIVNTPQSSYFSDSVKETYKANITTERNIIETALSTVITEQQSFRNASEKYRVSISTQEAAVTTAQGSRDKALTDISTYETLLKTQEAQLALKKAGSRDTDIKSAQARLNQAYADLQRTKAKLEDSILRAPIDGRITKVSLKEGEFSGDSRVITILGESPFRIELFVSEIDIPKVQYSQSGAIELDAYPNRDFWLTVTEIDPAATIMDGVPKYRIKMDFVENNDDLFKIGMTGDTDIITGVKFDVVYVPGRAVIQDENEEEIVRILHKDGSIEDRKVTVGMETETYAEIIDGVEEGETIVVLIKN